jgi:hypothetical protein
LWNREEPAATISTTFACAFLAVDFHLLNLNELPIGSRSERTCYCRGCAWQGSTRKIQFAIIEVSSRGFVIPDWEIPAPQSIRILDFSDPQHPNVAREFAGVTAISRDDRRGLIFLDNAEGIWILHQSRAEDPEVEKAYAHHVIYDH